MVVASVLAMVPPRRLPNWIGPLAVCVAGLLVGITPWAAARSAADDLAAPIAFLLIAVPLAVLLDETGFFASVAAMVGGGRHLRVGLWVMAALVTIVFNLDAAVVLLTPLYVRIALGRDEDPVVFGFMPALLASLASSVLPVSNLTNLIAVQRLGTSTGSFVGHLALPSIAAVALGGWIFLRLAPASPGASFIDDTVDRRALLIGIPIVIYLLVGFTIGSRVGAPAWAVAAGPLLVLMIARREVPVRHVPWGAAALAAGLGVLATSASQHLSVERVLALRGVPGEFATISAAALGSNAINNLPMMLLTLPGLDVHPERVWPVLLGANIGPTLWVTGALSTLLWQATMKRLGYSISARTYARTAARVGVPALLAAAGVHVALVVARR